MEIHTFPGVPAPNPIYNLNVANKISRRMEYVQFPVKSKILPKIIGPVAATT
tara:strand:+ start:854 stop:1009 length:156 start_codon:yes stop_codon:yes gene_type:complete